MRVVKCRGEKGKKSDLICGTWGQATTRQFHIVYPHCSRYNLWLLAGPALKVCIGVFSSKKRLEEIQSAASREDGKGHLMRPAHPVLLVSIPSLQAAAQGGSSI